MLIHKKAMFLLFVICISYACNTKEANPLEGLPSGIWAPTTPSKEFGVQQTSMKGDLSYSTPFFIIDGNPSTISYYNPISNQTEFPVEKDMEENWQVEIYSVGTLLLESNSNKDTLSCFFKNEQGVLEKVDYVLLMEATKPKITSDLLRKQLRGTTWSLSPEVKVVFHALPNEVDGSRIFSHYVHLVDSSTIKDVVGAFSFLQNKDFIFLEFQPQHLLKDEFFVLKDINKAQTELQLIPLIEGVYDSTLVLQKESKDIPYVDSLRKGYQAAVKANAKLN